MERERKRPQIKDHNCYPTSEVHDSDRDRERGCDYRQNDNKQYDTAWQHKCQTPRFLKPQDTPFGTESVSISSSSTSTWLPPWPPETFDSSFVGTWPLLRRASSRCTSSSDDAPAIADCKKKHVTWVKLSSLSLSLSLSLHLSFSYLSYSIFLKANKTKRNNSDDECQSTGITASVTTKNEGKKEPYPNSFDILAWRRRGLRHWRWRLQRRATGHTDLTGLEPWCEKKKKKKKKQRAFFPPN